MDYITITSETYEEWNKLYGKMSIKYWIDNNNVYWYAYEDICDILELKNQIANKLYNTIVNEGEKCITYDRNNFNNQGDQNEIVREWITSDALRRLIKRNNDRNNLLIKTINNLEVVCDSHDVYEEDEELKARIDETIRAANARDYEVYYYQIYKQYNSKTCRDILDKLGIVNKENEQIIDEVRECIYDPYCEEFKWESISKKPDAPDEEKRKMIYKKHREEGKKSTCPTWLKDCLR